MADRPRPAQRERVQEESHRGDGEAGIEAEPTSGNSERGDGGRGRPSGMRVAQLAREQLAEITGDLALVAMSVEQHAVPEGARRRFVDRIGDSAVFGAAG